MNSTCFACQTVAGAQTAPGGTIFENDYWLVDHCIGVLGVGSIVVKTKAHRENLWDSRGVYFSRRDPAIGF